MGRDVGAEERIGEELTVGPGRPAPELRLGRVRGQAAGLLEPLPALKDAPDLGEGGSKPSAVVQVHCLGQVRAQAALRGQRRRGHHGQERQRPPGITLRSGPNGRHRGPGDVPAEGKPSHLAGPLIADGRKDSRIEPPSLQGPNNELGVQVVVALR
eukprot:4255902-Alexandrium_andersonii.AAC.1